MIIIYVLLLFVCFDNDVFVDVDCAYARVKDFY